MHSEPDYGIRIRKEMSCDAVVAQDPCFGTFACFCNNGYYSFASTMPEVIPDTYGGYAKTIEDMSKVIADQLAI